MSGAEKRGVSNHVAICIIVKSKEVCGCMMSDYWERVMLYNGYSSVFHFGGAHISCVCFPHSL